MYWENMIGRIVFFFRISMQRDFSHVYLYAIWINEKVQVENSGYGQTSASQDQLVMSYKIPIKVCNVDWFTAQNHNYEHNYSHCNRPLKPATFYHNLILTFPSVN